MIHRFRRKTGLYGSLILGIVVAGVILTIGYSYARTHNHKAGNAARIIVIDPGHGGYDTGVTGPSGTREKDVNLAFARLMAAGLDAREYRAYLVRTGDYDLDIAERTAKANRAGADLFVSIHCGGGYARQKEGADIFYISEAATDKNAPAPRPSLTFRSADDNAFYASWHKMNERHAVANRAIAKEVQQALPVVPGTSGEDNTISLRNVGLTEARLSVLEGADMPAVLIEIGCLTNPVEESRLQNPDFLSAAAERVCDAIDRFFKKPETN